MNPVKNEAGKIPTKAFHRPRSDESIFRSERAFSPHMMLVTKQQTMATLQNGGLNDKMFTSQTDETVSVETKIRCSTMSNGIKAATNATVANRLGLVSC